MSKLYSAIVAVLVLMTIVTVGFSSTVAQSVRPTEAAATEQPTLRDKLIQPVPLVASFEVKGKHHGVYQLANVNGGELDQGDYALENDYEVGDVVTVLFATEDSTEIAGEVLVGTADELDLPHGGAGK